MFKYLIPIFALTCISLQANEVCDQCKHLYEAQKYIEGYELATKALEGPFLSVKEKVELLELRWFMLFMMAEFEKAKADELEILFLRRHYPDQFNN